MAFIADVCLDDGKNYSIRKIFGCAETEEAFKQKISEAEFPEGVTYTLLKCLAVTEESGLLML